MYEAIDDPAIASALFEAAVRFLRARGLTKIQGPVNLSMNHDCGLLVDGFDSPPVLMMPYNPGHYVAHFESVLGLKKAKDLYAFWLDAHTEPPPKVVRVAEKIRVKEGITVRPIRMQNFSSELKILKDILNSAWEKNWGFVPFTEEEFDHTARDMKRIAIPDLVLIAEVHGEPVAFSATLPDFNQALIKIDGKLTRYGLPIGLLKLLWHSKKINQLRLILLGVKQKHRKQGLDAILYLETLRTARRLGYKGGEISWTLEDNILVNRAIERMGGKRYKTYRIYEQEI